MARSCRVDLRATTGENAPESSPPLLSPRLVLGRRADVGGRGARLPRLDPGSAAAADSVFLATIRGRVAGELRTTVAMALRSSSKPPSDQ
jgi:hypothetical protein